MTALLFTQCLQRDFVCHLDPFEPLPNELHIGHAEALRLLGEDPPTGPLVSAIAAARAQPDLALIHIRDWHDAADADQREHLTHFGDHCLAGTPGAGFVFAEVEGELVVDAIGLNDFAGTGLAASLAPYADEACRVGVVGVWTDAKVSFLAYELCTRYPRWEIAVCSALTASSSRLRHFGALERLHELLGVRVIDSAGEFVSFLGGTLSTVMPEASGPAPKIEGPVEAEDAPLVRALFRESREVSLRALGGGYSGNAVLSAESVDRLGRVEVPHVVKIGPREAMGAERAAFERIEDVLGNCAPRIAAFADLGERGALKYRYASMTGGAGRTFQKAFMQGLPMREVERVLKVVFEEQLGRLYHGALWERGDLLKHYQFDPRWAGGVRARVEALELPGNGREVEVVKGREVGHPALFYEEFLPNKPRAGAGFWQAWVHGDLNGANILLDEHENVWLIDFFHARRAHALMDLIKLENDLLYLFTPLADEAALARALDVTDALLAPTDLLEPLPEEAPHPELARSWATLRMLRSFYAPLVRSDRAALQLWVGQLRYAAHTLGFDEATPLQRRWALYTASRAAERVQSWLSLTRRLRVDWLPAQDTAPGKVGLTLLPGRKDRGRDLFEDLEALRQDGVERVLCLVPRDELEAYGVGDLLGALSDAGFVTAHVPIPDQQACSLETAREGVAFVARGAAEGARVLIHCVGGLGRSGMIAAAYLTTLGHGATEAIELVRRCRSPRAVETEVQAELVRAFASARG